MSRAGALPTPMPEPLLGVEDVMVWLAVSDKFVRRHQRELGGRRVGGYLRFERADIQAYLDRGQVTGAVMAVPTPLDEEREKRRPALKHTTSNNPLDDQPW